MNSGESSLAPPLREKSRLAPGSSGAIVGAFKSTTARLINGLRHTPATPVWQRNYYEHIVRDDNGLARIRAYIDANPANWQADQENQ
jgi:putative transposase